VARSAAPFRVRPRSLCGCGVSAEPVDETNPIVLSADLRKPGPHIAAQHQAQGDAEGALIPIEEALALARETGEHWSDAFLHRCRGQILLKRDPVNTASAEDALLTAIAIAQQQKARSFELRAALSLAKLYHSTDRPADAHAVLASALKGFSPTPEFPEIAEAQKLLAALTA
jgi:predicted ATPase